MPKRDRGSWRSMWGLLGVCGLGALAVASLGGPAVAARAAAPRNTAGPSVTGSAQEGQRLVGHRGQWNGNPTSYGVVWQRCDRDGGSCASISGTFNANSYLLKHVDVDNRVRFRVVAKNADGNTAADSAASAIVAPATPPVSNGCAKLTGIIPVEDISPPGRLVVDQTQIAPGRITRATRELTVRFHVSACGGPVQGALVYVTALPYDQFAPAAEQATDADGWATLQLRALAGYPVSRKQQLLVMFVRARKPGEDPLGGISTRRLVSFHVNGA